MKKMSELKCNEKADWILKMLAELLNILELWRLNLTLHIAKRTPMSLEKKQNCIWASFEFVSLTSQSNGDGNDNADGSDNDKNQINCLKLKDL